MPLDVHVTILPWHLGQFLLWSTAGATRRLRVAAKGTTFEGLGEEIALVTWRSWTGLYLGFIRKGRWNMMERYNV
jgi:hypothetical protein